MRFDVVYAENGCFIQEHFCREWDEDGGCYGTNPNHGVSFDEARDMVSSYYHAKAHEWQGLTQDKWLSGEAP